MHTSLKLLIVLCSIFSSLYSHAASLFSIESFGSANHLSITLCLNGKGRVSCENHNVTSDNLSIKTVIPNRTYALVGIKINTPGFTPQGCRNNANGFCIFPANNSSTNIFVSKNSGYTIGGLITGLTAGDLVLQNNGSNDLTVTSGASSLEFPVTTAYGGSYNVAIKGSPSDLF